MLLKIITKKVLFIAYWILKVLFIDDKNMQQVRNTVFAEVGLKLTCGAILLSWFWPERVFIDKTQVLIFSFFKNGLKNFLNCIFIITCTSFNILDQ